MDPANNALEKVSECMQTKGLKIAAHKTEPLMAVGRKYYMEVGCNFTTENLVDIMLQRKENFENIRKYIARIMSNKERNELKKKEEEKRT